MKLSLTLSILLLLFAGSVWGDKNPEESVAIICNGPNIWKDSPYYEEIAFENQLKAADKIFLLLQKGKENEAYYDHLYEYDSKKNEWVTQNFELETQTLEISLTDIDMWHTCKAYLNRETLVLNQKHEDHYQDFGSTFSGKDVRLTHTCKATKWQCQLGDYSKIKNIVDSWIDDKKSKRKF